MRVCKVGEMLHAELLLLLLLPHYVRYIKTNSSVCVCMEMRRLGKSLQKTTKAVHSVYLYICGLALDLSHSHAKQVAVFHTIIYGIRT